MLMCLPLVNETLLYCRSSLALGSGLLYSACWRVWRVNTVGARAVRASKCDRLVWKIDILPLLDTMKIVT